MANSRQRVRRPRETTNGHNGAIVPTSGPVTRSTHRQIIKIHRSATLGNVPTGLQPGELAVEYASDPPLVWVGVEAAIDPAGRRLIRAAPVTVADTPPSVSVNGDLWWDSVSGQLFIRYADPTSVQWVLANVSEPGPQGIQGIQGNQGIQGPPPFSPSTSSFTVPPIGGSVTVDFESVGWLSDGLVIFIGGMYGRVTSISGNSVTLTRL